VQALYRRPLLALMVAAALWGGAVTGTKYALGGFDPITLLSIELMAATGGLWAVLLVRGYRPPRTWRLPLLLGLLEPALAYLGDTSGLSRTTAVDGSILSGLEPALVVVLAAFLLGEVVTRPVILAVVLALAGLTVLAGAGYSHSAGIGDLYVAGGILSASIYTIVAKRFDDGSDTLPLTTWQFSAASILSLPIAIMTWSTGSGHPLAAPPRYWVAAVGVGLGGFAMSFLLYNAVITRVDAGRAAVVLNLIPVFGLLSAVIFLGEKPTATTGIGATLIGTSVVYFTISDRRGARGTVTPPTNHLATASPPMARNRLRAKSARNPTHSTKQSQNDSSNVRNTAHDELRQTASSAVPDTSSNHSIGRERAAPPIADPASTV
jgi:O-acetylserine/cysteine efflux transporter